MAEMENPPSIFEFKDRAEKAEAELKKAWTYVGRLTLFLIEHDLTEEWQAKSIEHRAKDAAEAARNPTGGDAAWR